MYPTSRGPTRRPYSTSRSRPGARGDGAKGATIARSRSAVRRNDGMTVGALRVLRKRRRPASTVRALVGLRPRRLRAGPARHELPPVPGDVRAHRGPEVDVAEQVRPDERQPVRQLDVLPDLVVGP